MYGIRAGSFCSVRSMFSCYGGVAFGFWTRLGFQPAFHGSCDMAPLGFLEDAAAADAVPFLETGPATGCCRMLRHEDRVSAKRSLLAVVDRICRGEAPVDEVSRMI